MSTQFLHLNLKGLKLPKIEELNLKRTKEQKFSNFVLLVLMVQHHGQAFFHNLSLLENAIYFFY